MFKRIEKSFSYKKASTYDNNISFMGNVLYLYDRIPFLSEVRDAYFDENGCLLSTFSIAKKEIDLYIKDNKIKMTKSRFDLNNEETWII